GSLKRKGVEPGRMAAQRQRTPLGIGQETLSDPATTQFLVHPQQVDEQPAGIDMADQPGANRAGIVAHKDAEIGEGRIAEKRLVVFAETVIDDLAVFPGWIILEAEAKPGRQIHWHPY